MKQHPYFRLLAEALVLSCWLAADPNARGSSALSKTERDEITVQIADQYPELEALYRHLHTHPELSLREQQTSRRLADELRKAGCTVTTGVGAFGVVGMLQNGKGPTVLLRS